MPNRILEAWRVLMGQRLTPVQIQAEWVEYQQIFRDLLETFSASLARQSKAEKKRLDRLGDGAEDLPVETAVNTEAGRKARKAALYHRMFGSAGRSPSRHVEAP